MTILTIENSHLSEKQLNNAILIIKSAPFLDKTDLNDIG